MAGNIVKWWKHKILGGYKQFTVLQECATDSEELIFPIRAPSACSAPPDLLLTSDREQMLKVKSSKQQQHPHSQQHQMQSSHHQSSQLQQQQQHHHHQQQQQQQNHNHHYHKMSSTTAQQQHPKESSFRKCSGKTATVKSDPDRVRLEEFTCDVSLEDGKKPQPLQFSFTLYDLDGHGRITKDDIAGIVSTIYESIGKSVVVPHYGSKTINVRLTVSPDGKSKSSGPAIKKAAITPRRRYRPRKLISDDDDGSDTSENAPRAMRARANTVAAASTTVNNNNNFRQKESLSVSQRQMAADGHNKSAETVETTFHNNLSGKAKNSNSKNENIYESISNLKCCNIQTAQVNATNDQSLAALNTSCATTVICRDCSLEGCPNDETLALGAVVIPTAAVNASAIVSSRAKRKVVRKSRSSRKASKIAEDLGQPRARSLSVGNENCYENMIGNPQEECWKSSLCRRELIEIIRESMVKNSLCFQPNRKAQENSPKHRHRSHTISARVGGAADQCGEKVVATQQALVVAHEANLCGYDSYLHQTICAAANVNHAALHLNGGVVANGGVFTAPPITTSTPNRLLQHHSHHAKLKRKEHRLAMATRNQTHRVVNHPVKLSTALLSQHYPNLSAEQKLTRSINHVEKWLDKRSPKLVNKAKLSEETAERSPQTAALKLSKSNSKEEVGQKPSKLNNALTTDLLLENLKISEDIAELNVVTPKKVFNKGCLISSATKKNIQTHHTTKTVSTTTALGSTIVTDKPSKNLIQLQYASIPVDADPSECENLIRMSDAEEDFAPQQHQQPQPQLQSSPSSPTHHNHHHSPGGATSLIGDHSGSSASAASTTAVHRYVHEHIHHHYHHFENDPDES
ncbi:protein naked cuticle homolog [Toxorhynchites rutilus septentrionalis]|uniref:protein naked cuticle homolog n=1 Tax=Toxorhynchites rutilus septentrionalis TaxID=329112 RepID=UPI002478A276|nr:protein naked cuticle homolog [Toxorhynchites rutilus septentrionalis]